MVNALLLTSSVGRNIRENVTIKTSRKRMESKSRGHTDDTRTSVLRI